jgi:hypothetical protein
LLIILIDSEKNISGNSVSILSVPIVFKVPKVHEITMPDSNIGINNHKYHSSDRIGSSINLGNQLDNKLIIISTNINPKEINKPHKRNQQRHANLLLNKFILIRDQPFVDLPQIRLHNMIVALSEKRRAQEGFSATVDLAETFRGTVDQEVQQVALLCS